MDAAKTITSWKLSQIRGTSPFTERERCRRGYYGPLAGTKPLAVFRDEVERRGIKLPPEDKAKDLAERALLRMLELLTGNKLFDRLHKVAIVTAFAAVDTEYRLGLGKMFLEENRRTSGSCPAGTGDER